MWANPEQTIARPVEKIRQEEKERTTQEWSAKWQDFVQSLLKAHNTMLLKRRSLLKLSLATIYTSSNIAQAKLTLVRSPIDTIILKVSPEAIDEMIAQIRRFSEDFKFALLIEKTNAAFKDRFNIELWRMDLNFSLSNMLPDEDEFHLAIYKTCESIDAVVDPAIIFDDLRKRIRTISGITQIEKL